ncbi:hypothetical protein EMIHUDRAFT_78668, partial [Emiliania huxleyi CCMP1516]|uniref:Uncharacterized protein n=2 Tax=Emiliania huxleyi TaxID=2903 RepID=A0A0D3IIX2_EMIH1
RAITPRVGPLGASRRTQPPLIPSGAGRSPSGHSASGHRVATRFSQCAPSPREGETKLASELSRRASGP